MILRSGGKKVGRMLLAAVLAGAIISTAGTAAERAVIGAVTPGTLGMGEEVVIKWNYDDGDGGSTGMFDIALYKCGDAFCGQQDCGSFVEQICDKPSKGCMDGLGNYRTTISTGLTAADSYKIRVGLHDSTLYDCSSTFSIVDTIPVPTLEVYYPEVAEDGDPYLTSSSSQTTDDASTKVSEATSSQSRRRRRELQSSSESPEIVGTTGTYADGNDTLLVRWAYDDGFGGSFARFDIDLYYCGGACDVMGDCGQAIARLCEACPDSAGEEYVTLPDPYTSHNYKIRVSTWEGVMRPISECSPKFEIKGRDRPEYSTPSPTQVKLIEETSSTHRTPGALDNTADLPSTPVVRPSEYPDWGEADVPPAKPVCDATDLPDVRYSGTTGRIYVERNGTRGGCFTLTQIWESGTRPLYPIDPATNKRVDVATGVWLLTEELYVTDGVTLQFHGTARGGDCDELRLLSDATTFINLRAHGGSFSFLGTKVISWDEGKGTVDTHHEDGRSYVSAVSEVIYDPDQLCEGNAKDEMGEARMDVIDTEMGYLGYHESESYGLVWKVRGFCVDKSNEEVFADVNVYGDMINSNIHHNYFGMYSYGHQGGNWSYNKMHDNIEYGFDPHDDSDYLHIVGNDVWGNGNHGIIASKRCDHVIISDNHVSHGVNTGLFLHRSSDHAIVTGNHVHSNGDAGLAVLESFYMNVNNNVFKDNRYGIRFSVGAGYNWIHDNIIHGSYRYNLFTYLGSDAPDVEGTTGFPIGNVFWRNYISGTYFDSVKLKEASATSVINNRIGTAASVMFESCSDTAYYGTEEEEFLMPNIKEDTCFTPDSELEPAC